jgi:hypothetical protein
LGYEPLPEANRNWLRQYLDDAEIDKYFKYSPKVNRHYFVHGDDDGVYFEGRSVTIGNDGEFTHQTPKVISGGTKPKVIFGSWRGTHKLVLVEDVVSAIKVSRHCGAMPLFGASISTDLMLWIAGLAAVQEVIIWLDSNKYNVAVEAAHKMGKLKLTRVICTDLDPKQVSDDEIRELVELP